MTKPARPFLTYLLLAAYGTTALLGYGLHVLAPHGGHHHLAGVTCASHEHHAHEDHDADGGHCHASDLLAAVQAACPDGPCDVCEFLAQARSTQPQLTTADVWQHVWSTSILSIPLPESQSTLGPHAPRGPPLSTA